MSKYDRIVFAIAVVGAVACLLSFLLSLSKGTAAGIVFLPAGLFCLSNVRKSSDGDIKSTSSNRGE